MKLPRSVLLGLLIGMFVVARPVSAAERPGEDEVAHAREFTKALTPVQVGALNLVRRLAPAAADLARLPEWRRPGTLAALGEAFPAEQANLASWRKLRLAALLRAGVPADAGLVAELDGYLESKLPGGVLADCVLELIVLEAIATREDPALAGIRERACKRRLEAAEAITWPAKRPPQAPGAARPNVASGELVRVLHEALCREFLRRAVARGETLPTDLEGERARFVTELVLCIDLAAAAQDPAGGGWSVTVARSQRDRLLACALFTLARTDLEAAVRDPVAQKKLAAAHSTLQAWSRGALDSTTSNWVFSGDATAVSALVPADMLPATLRPATRALPPRSLDSTNPGHLAPGVDRMSLAAALGWMPRARNPATTATEYPVRSLAPAALREQTQAAATALALLGGVGGLACAEPTRLLPVPLELAATTSALTTLELTTVPLTFEERVNDALDRAGVHLAQVQQKDGSFPGSFATQIGGQAVVLLAMCHAGIDRNHPAIVRGMKHLLGLIEGGASAGQRVYGYGIALMLLQEIYNPEQEKLGVLGARKAREYRKAVHKMWRKLPARDRKLIAGMVKTLAADYAGLGWGYQGPTTEKPGKGAATTTGASWCDNSNACYALLGLKAASFLGAPFDRRIFMGEAQRLFGTHIEDEKMAAITVALERGATATMASVQPGGWVYSGTVDLTSAKTKFTPARSITANCIASLAVCRDELRMNDAWADTAERAGRRAFASSLHWLGKRTDYPASLTHAVMNTGSSDGHGLFYELYGLERAGVLTATVDLDGVDWYRELASILMDGQAPDGSWPDLMRGSSPQMVNVSFVVLILSRSAVPTHERPKPVITDE